MFECVYKKVEASEETARTEQDLSAQQRAATSALVAAIISALTFVVTGVGVWFVKRTLDATLKAVEDTSEATDAMRAANEIANMGLELAWKPNIAIEMAGPYFMPKEWAAPMGLDKSIVVMGLAKITNQGTSPILITGTTMGIDHDLFDEHREATGSEQYYELEPGSECFLYRGTLICRTVEDIPSRIGIGILKPKEMGRYLIELPHIKGTFDHVDPLGIARRTHYAFRPKDFRAQSFVRHGGDRLNYDEKIDRAERYANHIPRPDPHAEVKERMGADKASAKKA